MIEIYTRNFDLHIIVQSPNLAFLCRNLDYKPNSINQSDQPCSCHAFLSSHATHVQYPMTWVQCSCGGWYLVFVAHDGLTGTGNSVTSDVPVVIELRGVVLGEGVLCEMCICLAGGGVGGVRGE